MPAIDLASSELRSLNEALHALNDGTNETRWEIANPRGAHAVAVGVNAPVEIDIRGSVGYYCAGMNRLAKVTVHGSAGPGIAENMMSGEVVVKGDASQYAGATGKGGLLLIEGWVLEDDAEGLAGFALLDVGVEPVERYGAAGGAQQGSERLELPELNVDLENIDVCVACNIRRIIRLTD